MMTFLGCRLVAVGQEPLVAVAEPRLHHQLLPDIAAAERWNTSSASFTVPDRTVQAAPSVWLKQAHIHMLL